MVEPKCRSANVCKQTTQHVKDHLQSENIRGALPTNLKEGESDRLAFELNLKRKSVETASDANFCNAETKKRLPLTN